MKTKMLFFLISMSLSSAAVAQTDGKKSALGEVDRHYFNRWMVINTYPTGTDTFIYTEGRTDAVSLGGWDNSHAITDKQMSIVIDDEEKTIMVLPNMAGKKAIYKPVALPDSILSYLDYSIDTSDVVISDTAISYSSPDVVIKFCMNNKGNYVERILLTYTVHQEGNPKEDENPSQTEWILLERVTDKAQLQQKININNYIVRSGKEIKPAEKYKKFEFINLLNVYTD